MRSVACDEVEIALAYRCLRARCVRITGTSSSFPPPYDAFVNNKAQRYEMRARIYGMSSTLQDVRTSSGISRSLWAASQLSIDLIPEGFLTREGNRVLKRIECRYAEGFNEIEYYCRLFSLIDFFKYFSLQCTLHLHLYGFTFTFYDISLNVQEYMYKYIFKKYRSLPNTIEKSILKIYYFRKIQGILNVRMVLYSFCLNIYYRLDFCEIDKYNSLKLN